MESISGKLKLDASHRFVKLAAPVDSIQRDHLVQNVSGKVDGLTPATKRVLVAVLKALWIGYDQGKGYTFRQYVNRAEIARVLERKALVPYDIRMLRQLCDLRLLQEAKHPLPRKQLGDIWLGAGAEFVYTIHPDTLYALLHHDQRERSRLLALKPRPTNTPSRLSDVEFDMLLKRESKARKSTLWERVLDWLNI